MSIRNLLRRAGLGARIAGAGLVALAASGCLSDIVKADDRDVIPPDQLTTTAGAAALYAGALLSFGQAIDGNAGGSEGQTLISGMLTDEWFHSGTFGTRQDYDMRSANLDNGTLANTFRNLQDARTAATRAITAVTNTTASAATDARLAALYNRIGYVYLAAAMNYCNGVPFSEIDADGNLVYGQPLSTQAIVDLAIAEFDKALAGAAGTGSVNHHTARLLKGRALTLKGLTQLGAAATLVASVPTSFVALSEHSIANGTNENGVYVFNWLSERWSMGHLDGGNGLPFRGAGNGTVAADADPRILWRRLNGTNVGFDNVSPQYDWMGSGGRDVAHPFARGAEARLMEAEAVMVSNPVDFIDKLNALRTTVAGLTPLTDPGTAASRVDLLFRERAFWLYGTGSRLSDLRRMVRQYGRNAETVFPSGAYFRAGNYGTDVNFAVPTVENQNPNFTACTDRNA